MEKLTFQEKLDAIKKLLVTTLGEELGDQILTDIGNNNPNNGASNQIQRNNEVDSGSQNVNIFDDVEFAQDTIMTDDSAGAKGENVIIIRTDNNIHSGLNIGDIVEMDESVAPTGEVNFQVLAASGYRKVNYKFEREVIFTSRLKFQILLIFYFIGSRQN